MTKYLKMAAVLVALAMLAGCFNEQDVPKIRAEFAKDNPGQITIAIVGPLIAMQKYTGFLNGIKMAAAEVNVENNGAIRLALRVEDDRARLTCSRLSLLIRICLMTSSTFR